MPALRSHRSAHLRPLAVALVTLLSVAPSVAFPDSDDHVLTSPGLLHFTNTARRSSADLKSLAEASLLNAVAQARLKDMFDRQYFSHTSPVTEEGAAEIADRLGYKYLAIAENLARGAFTNNQDMVRVWMESGRHRQNILSSGYTEMGVAVRRDVLDGQLLWIGVQVFARPLSDCPQPDAALVARIDALKLEVAAVKSQATALQLHVGLPDRRNGGEVTLYNGRVIEYNALIAHHNALADEVRRLVWLHTAEAERLASCVGSAGI